MLPLIRGRRSVSLATVSPDLFQLSNSTILQTSWVLLEDGKFKDGATPCHGHYFWRREGDSLCIDVRLYLVLFDRVDGVSQAVPSYQIIEQAYSWKLSGRILPLQRILPAGLNTKKRL